MSRNDLAAITCYFNPEHYKNRLKNYKLFKYKIQFQGIPCLTVECVLGDDYSELEPGPDVIVVRAKDCLWQKERLLNIAIDNVDPRDSKIAWLDCDILFSDYNWTDKTSDLLDKYPIIQPWNRVALLTPAGPESRTSVMYWTSFAMIWGDTPIPEKHGHTGFAWAARRDLLVKHHLYDASIIGHGDHLIGHAIYGDVNGKCVNFQVPTPEFKEHFCEWALPFYEDVQGQCVSLTGEIKHLWHGELSDRHYSSRHIPLKGFEFDPKKDIRLNSQGVWEWASDKPELHEWVSSYFKKRLEDGRSPKPGVQIYYPSPILPLPVSPPGPGSYY